MSNAKVRARRRRRGNRAWTAAMTPVELFMPNPAFDFALLEYTPHTCHVLKNGEPHPAWQRTTETHLTSSQPNFQNLKRLAGWYADVRSLTLRPTLMPQQAIDEGERFMTACRKADKA